MKNYLEFERDIKELEEVKKNLPDKEKIDPKRLEEAISDDLLQEKLLKWLEENNTVSEKKSTEVTTKNKKQKANNNKEEEEKNQKNGST